MIGRGPEADVPLQDDGASRATPAWSPRLARPPSSTSPAATGTWVNGERVEGRACWRLVMWSLSALPTSCSAVCARCWRAPLEPGAFRARLDDEVERALSFERPLALLAVALGGGADLRAVALAADAALAC